MPKLNGGSNLFEPKVTHRDGGKRYGGYLTKAGAKAFEAARRALAKAVKVKRVSDADVVEACVRPESVQVPK